MDQRIEVFGCTRRDLNGKRGVATDFRPIYDMSDGVDLSISLYTVLLDTGESVKVKRAHVRAEPGAKGKGKKKGRGRRAKECRK